MIKVGDRVAFSRADAAISGHAAACFGVDFINSLEFQKCKFHKGTVTKIRTHFLFFFKLKEPIYLIDDYYVVKNVKLVMSAKEYKFCGIQFNDISPEERSWVHSQNRDFLRSCDDKLAK